MPLEFLFGAFQRGAIENARLRDAYVLQPLLQRVLFELLSPDDVDLADCGPLLHDDHEHAVFYLETHVAKETGRVKRLDRCRSLFVVNPIADLDRQIAEDCPGVSALHAFDADILDREGIEAESRSRQREQRHGARQRSQELCACQRYAPARGIAVRRVGKYH